MKIGIDLRTVEGGSEYRGIGRYVFDLVQTLSEIDHTNDYVLFSTKETSHFPRLKLHKDFKYTTVQIKNSRLRTTRFIRFLFLSGTPLKIDRYGLDVFFEPDIFQSVSVGSTPFVPVLYDLIPFLFKDDYQQISATIKNPLSILVYLRAKAIWWRRKRDLLRYKKAAQTISISEHSKQDLLAMIRGIKADRVTPIHLAAGSGVSIQIPKNPPKRLSILKNKKFIFYVGGSDPRKGLLNLIRSMNETWLSLPELYVVLAGKEVGDPSIPSTQQLMRASQESNKPQQIVNLGFINDEELSYLFAYAQAFVFPSIYEGFGLPILEAMQLKCPVIAYNNSSIPEVAGDAALLISNTSELAPAIIKLVQNPKLRDSMIEKGTQQTKKFSWTATAQQTLEVLEEAAER